MILALVAFAVAVQDTPAVAAAVAMPADAAAAPVIPQAEIVSSSSFILSQPRLHAAGETVRVDGTVCRRPNRSLISPTRVQIDHLSASRDLVDTSYAYLPAIRQREDQRCVHYGAKLKTPPQAGDTVRICLAQRSGQCTKGE